MSTERNTRRIILGGALIIIALLGGYGFFKDIFGSHTPSIPRVIPGNYTAVDQQVTLPIDGLKTIELNSVAADSTLTTGESSREVSARLTGSSQKDIELKTKVEGTSGKVYVDYPTPDFGSSRSLRLEIILPAAYAGKLALHSVSGDVMIADGASLGVTSVSTVSGDIKSREGLFESLIVSSVSGDVSITRVDSSSTRISTTSGDIDLSQRYGAIELVSLSGTVELALDRVDNDIEVKSTSGDISIAVPESSDLLVNFSSMSGDVSSRLDLAQSSLKDHKLEGTSGSGRYQLSANTMSGDINLRKL